MDGVPGHLRASFLEMGLAPYSGAPPLLQRLPHELVSLPECASMMIQPSYPAQPPLYCPHLSPSRRDPTCSGSASAPLAEPWVWVYSCRSLESSPSPAHSWPQLLHLQNGLKNVGQGKLSRTRSEGFRFTSRLCDWARAFLSLGLCDGEGNTSCLLCTFSGSW